MAIGRPDTEETTTAAHCALSCLRLLCSPGGGLGGLEAERRAGITLLHARRGGKGGLHPTSGMASCAASPDLAGPKVSVLTPTFHAFIILLCYQHNESDMFMRYSELHVRDREKETQRQREPVVRLLASKCLTDVHSRYSELGQKCKKRLIFFLSVYVVALLSIAVLVHLFLDYRRDLS